MPPGTRRLRTARTRPRAALRRRPSPGLQGALRRREAGAWRRSSQRPRSVVGAAAPVPPRLLPAQVGPPAGRGGAREPWGGWAAAASWGQSGPDRPGSLAWVPVPAGSGYRKRRAGQSPSPGAAPSFGRAVLVPGPFYTPGVRVCWGQGVSTLVRVQLPGNSWGGASGGRSSVIDISLLRLDVLPLDPSPVLDTEPAPW